MATKKKKVERLTDAQLGKRLRDGLRSVKELTLRDDPHRRTAAPVFAYLAGYLVADDEVSRLCKAFSVMEFDHDAFKDIEVPK